MCQVVVRLLYEARNSGIKSSASDFHHYSLEVATLGLLSRHTKRESQANIRVKVCTLTSEKETLNTNLSVEDSSDWFHLRNQINTTDSQNNYKETEKYKHLKQQKNTLISDKDTLDEPKRHLQQLETLKRQQRDAKQPKEDIKQSQNHNHKMISKESGQPQKDVQQNQIDKQQQRHTEQLQRDKKRLQRNFCSLCFFESLFDF